MRAARYLVPVHLRFPFLCHSGRERRAVLDYAGLPADFSLNSRGYSAGSATILQASPCCIYSADLWHRISSWKSLSSPSLIPAVKPRAGGFDPSSGWRGSVRSTSHPVPVSGRARLLPSLFQSRAGSGEASPSHRKTSLLPPREVHLPNVATTRRRGKHGFFHQFCFGGTSHRSGFLARRSCNNSVASFVAFSRAAVASFVTISRATGPIVTISRASGSIVAFCPVAYM